LTILRLEKQPLGAENGRIGLELVHKKKQPDFDVMMPEMDGYAVLDAARSPTTASLPLIFLNRKAEDRPALRHNLGADDYLANLFPKRIC
jgi:CheY-like chemotaxis protein